MKRSPKEIDITLPDGFSDKFIRDLQEAIALTDYGFKTEYLQQNLLSKYCDESLVPATSRRLAAIDKWLATERRNTRTNQRLQFGDAKFGWVEYDVLLNKIRKIINRILGPLPYPDVILNIVHTNGASTRVKRSVTSALHKLSGTAHLSASCVKHWLQSASMTPLADQALTLREDSTLFTVPKKSDIDRVACKEPEINMLLQRSVGKYIAKRLRRVGIDLTDQTVNQRLAQQAVETGLATYDLSSASDSITRQLVIELLPFDWWSLLDDLRVKSTIVDGVQHSLEMFSSMGNGFTFELESLLFYAITSAVCELSGFPGRISVYGDDIIAPNASYRRLKSVLGWFGFSLNPDKSFHTGAFRESCGKHYYGGFDVSPFFVRSAVSTLPDLIKTLNQILIWDGRGYGFFIDHTLLEFHRKYAAYVPRKFWGGVEPEDTSALVSGDPPRSRLAPITRNVRKGSSSVLYGEPAYRHWFMQREDCDTPVTIEPLVEVAYKATRCSKGWLSSWRPWLLRS